MLTIYEFLLPKVGYQEISVSGYQKCLSVKVQDEQIVLYALVDTDPALRATTLPVLVAGHGCSIERPDFLENWEFIGTVSIDTLVWHIFVSEPK